MLLQLNGLIDYVPIDKPARFSQSQVSSNRFNSVLFLQNVEDEQEIRMVCKLLAYFLRARFDVKFDREPNNEQETEMRSLFYSCRDFVEYYNDFRGNVEKWYKNCLTLMEVFGNSDATENETDDDGENNNTEEKKKREYQRNLCNVCKIVTECFKSFTADSIDPADWYVKLFYERTVSSEIPLYINMDTMSTLNDTFDTLCRLSVQSIDYCNSNLSIMTSAGLVLKTLLHFCSLGEVQMKVLDSTVYTTETVTQPTKVWGKINCDNDDIPDWLLVQTDQAVYRKNVSELPIDMFDSSRGDMYVSYSDFLSTLIMQTLNRLFTRLREWPMREDVDSWLRGHACCDNLHRFFLENGRNQQMWIRFRKHKRRGFHEHNEQTYSNACDDDNIAPQFNQRDTPSVYVKLDHLCDLYNEIALVARTEKPELSPQQQQLTENMSQLSLMLFNGNNNSGSSSSSNCSSGSGDNSKLKIKLPPNKAVVRERIDQLNHFKDNYTDFWLRGVQQVRVDKNESFKRTYAETCYKFLLATGSYRGVQMQQQCEQHAHTFSLEPPYVQMQQDLEGFLYQGCDECTKLLTPDGKSNMFQLSVWLRNVQSMIFPYQFLMLCSAFKPENDGNNYVEETLDKAVVLKMLEILAMRRLTFDAALKLLRFFKENRSICSFVVPQTEMVALFSTAIEKLPFLREMFCTH